ncbi:MAG: 3'(2'),5'-bisphosphate nucleotidase CysQ [Acidimicrobiales bacterium]|nr:3'(2'),5'-bisphosphate nucleotidase CysQ [Acidimicrobiales bacterium]
MITADRDDDRLAHDLAEEAGELLVEVRDRLSAEGVTTRELKDAGDRAAHDLLTARLAGLRPDDAVLSEEGSGADGPSGTARLSAERVWIIDPLDGTREFSEPPRTDWAVHVALVVGGVPLSGAVALPALGRVLTSSPAQPLPPAPPTRPRVIVSRSRPPAVALHLAEALGGELVELGSAGAKVAAVVEGEADVYPHAGGQYEWDSCAPVAVARAAGLVATRLDGSPLAYNNPDPYLPDLVVSHPAIAEPVRAILDAWLDEPRS